MTAIKIDKFGGLSPSTDARNLPPDGAQVARNLDMRFGDFRPAKGLGAPVAAVPAGTLSIFRTPSGQWLSSTQDADFVNAPVDEAIERVYLTSDNTYPQAWQGGAYRRLGVPAPTSAPNVTVIVNDEFDSGDAETATAAATTAVVDAVLAVDSETLFGNPAPSSLGPPVAFDSLYPKVQLHLKFDAWPLVDSSPQKRIVTAEGGVSHLTDNTGPLGVAGAGCGRFAGAFGQGGVVMDEIRRWTNEADPTWTVEASITSDVELEWLTIQSRDGNMREITFQRASGEYRTLTASVSTGLFQEQVRCKRTNGTAAVAAGVPTHIAVQCTGSNVQVYIDGVLCGTTPTKLGLELYYIGRSYWTGANAFQGKIDEFRLTFAARYTGNFTKPTEPYPTLAVPTGRYATHNEPGYSGLPTTSTEDAAYLVQVSPSGGGWVASNPADAYIVAMPGAQVTFGASQFWAIPLRGFRATALTSTSGAIQSAIAAVDNPATVPVDTLLTTEQAEALAPLLYALYDPSVSPVSALLADLNAAQANVQATLASGSDAAALTAKVQALTAASTAVKTYFASISSRIRTVLRNNAGDVFGSINSSVVTRDVETRGYVVTFVTDWGEESAPSPVSELLTLDQNDTVTVIAPSPAPGRFVVGWRLYRSSTTDRGSAFQLVDGLGASNAVTQNGAFAYFDIAQPEYTDAKKQAELQESLRTLTWVEPPENLRGLVALPNGILAGFYDKTVCFSEPYAGYAWPIEYRQAVKYKVVGLGVFGQTLVVLTEGHPYYSSGADAANMSMQEIETPQACVAKRTIAPVQGGVMYASPDGLCLAGPSGVEVLTTMAFSKEDWQALSPETAFGAFSDGSYYLFVNGA